MERPQPTTQLILEVTGYNKGLISAAHHGLYETPLNEFSSNLNLDEMLVVSAESWLGRKDDSKTVIELVQSGNIYEVFNYFNSTGFSWLNKNKAISEKLGPLYKQLNPYKGKTLEARLQRVNPESVKLYMEALKRPTDSYPSKNPKELAAEIAEMLSTYPWEYEPPVSIKPSPMQPKLL